MNEEIIRKTYYDPEHGLFSASKLYQKLKSKGISLSEIKNFISKQEVYQLHKPVSKPSIYFPVVSLYPNELWQIDIIDFSNISTTNSNFKYVLLCIDVFTRKVYCEAIKSKSIGNIIEAMSTILNIESPHKIQCDLGSEFVAGQFKKLMKDNDIEIQFIDPQDSHKLGVINRMCRTLRSMINRYLTMYKTTKYINVLQKLIDNYNNTYHTTIKCTPNEAYKNKENIVNLTMKKWNEAKANEPEFNVGDDVRYILNRTTFEKGSTAKFSKTIHKIVSRTEHMYKLDNGKNYKYYHLQKVTENQSYHPIQTRATTKQPTMEEIRKMNKINRDRVIEGIDLENIIKHKRERKPTDRLKF